LDDSGVELPMAVMSPCRTLAEQPEINRERRDLYATTPHDGRGTAGGADLLRRRHRGRSLTARPQALPLPADRRRYPDPRLRGGVSGHRAGQDLRKARLKPARFCGGTARASSTRRDLRRPCPQPALASGFTNLRR
jgi:hypothetical protein